MRFRHSKSGAANSGRSRLPRVAWPAGRIYCIVNTPDTRADPPDGPQVIR
jgi:hypothetical protein